MNEGQEKVEAHDQPSKVRMLLDLLKALAWPAFAFTVLFSFWTPLHEMANDLPGILRHTKSITVAGATFEATSGVVERASRDVRQVLGKLKPGDIRELLLNDLSVGGSVYTDNEEEIKEFHDLAGIGLVTESTPDEVAKWNKEKGEQMTRGVKGTRLSGSTREFLVSLLIDIISDTQETEKARPAVKHQK